MQIDATGGSGNLQIQVTIGASTTFWNGSATFFFDSETVVTYSVIDLESGCLPAEYPVTITIPQIYYDFSTVDSGCNEPGSGSIDLTIDDGGGLPYSISWIYPDGQTSSDEDIFNLSPGAYSLNIDFNSNNVECEINDVIIVESGDDFSVSTSVLSESCPNEADGSIALSPMGTGPFGVVWPELGAAEDDNLIVEGLSGGVFNYTVTDGSGCEVSGSVLLETNSYLFDFLGTTIVVEQGTAGIGEINEDDFANQVLWSSAYFEGDLIFKDGVDIFIDHADLYFSPSHEVIIEEGAEVDFGFCDLSAWCTNWRGIRVVGDRNTQAPSGELFMNEGSISFAEIAISTWDQSPTNNGVIVNVVIMESGKIQCHGTGFINNRLSLAVHYANGYAEGNNSQFTFCNFEVNDDLFDHFDNFAGMARYHDMRGFGFYACDFLNTTSDDQHVLSWLDRGFGIRSFNGFYDVTADDVLFEPCSFDGFDFAIRAFAERGLKEQLRIQGGSYQDMNKFNRNRRAIVVINDIYERVNWNDITIGEPTGVAALDAELDDYEGITIMGGQLWQVSENNISAAGFGGESFGIRIQDSQTISDYVYKNTVSNCTYAFLASGNNVSPLPGLINGLKYACNTLGGNDHDLVIANLLFGSPNIAGIGPIQFGINPDNPLQLVRCENHFSDGSNLVWQIQNDGNTPMTYHCSQSCPITSFIDPPNSYTEEENNNDHGCDQEILEVGTGDHSMLVHSHNVLMQNQELWIEPKFLFTTIIDEGSTSELQELVQNAWSEDTWQMRDDLLALSPNVSMNVLYDVADRTDLFPHPVALEIILANPQSLRDSRFITYLETKADPMPSYMVDLVWAARDDETSRLILESELAVAETGLDLAISDFMTISFDIADSSISIDSTFLVAGALGTRYNLIEETLLNDGSVAAIDELDEIETQRWSPSGDRDIINYRGWLNVLIEMSDSGLDWTMLDAGQIEDMRTIGDEFQNWGGRNALEVLDFFYDEDHFIPPMIEGTWAPRSSINPQEESNELEVIVFPNPADQKITLEIDVPGLSPLDLKFFDSIGREIAVQTFVDSHRSIVVNTGDWENGMYFFQITRDNLKPFSGKFEVLHSK